MRAREDAEDPSRAVAERFADAWARGDLEAAWRLTTARTREAQPLALFRDSYQQATRAATVARDPRRARRRAAGRPGHRAGGAHHAPFGELRGTIDLPVERTGDTAAVAWAPDLRLPGLEPGESRYNPVAESVMGAKGLMQVIPKYHQEKLFDHGGEHALLEPEVNIQVGAQILREYQRRFGDTETALQMYAGALDEPTAQYSAKVFAEKARLDALASRPAKAGNPSSSFFQILHASRVGEAHERPVPFAPKSTPGVAATASFSSSSRAKARASRPTSA